mmetsp:Transcript_14199/g.2283  ORF Transcript_14199/g.2283 Transcript_14199/m.2283 type:complete len:201 (+) Transcript_14199:461-1063(+)
MISLQISASSPLPVVVTFYDYVLHLAQFLIKGSHPNSSSDIYTIPHLDTVAGEAFLRFSTSNTSLTLSVIAILSLLGKVRILLSSKTVFKLSIHRVSTGPSHIIHVLFLLFLLLHFCHIVENTPGIHSSVIGIFLPYSSSAVIALGFSLLILCFTVNYESALVSTVYIELFPVPVGPTIINPCLTLQISYNWIILAYQLG